MRTRCASLRSARTHTAPPSPAESTYRVPSASIGVSRGASTVVRLARWVIVRWNVLDHEACSPGWQLAQAPDPTYPPAWATFGAPFIGGAGFGRTDANAIAAPAMAAPTAIRAPPRALPGTPRAQY